MDVIVHRDKIINSEVIIKSIIKTIIFYIQSMSSYLRVVIGTYPLCYINILMVVTNVARSIHKQNNNLKNKSTPIHNLN